MGCSLRLRIGGTWQGQETLLGWVLIACPLCALNVFGAGLMSVPDESPRARFLTRGRGSYARCATSLAFKIPKSIQMGFLYVADMVPASCFGFVLVWAVDRVFGCVSSNLLGQFLLQRIWGGPFAPSTNRPRHCNIIFITTRPQGNLKTPSEFLSGRSP